MPRCDCLLHATLSLFLVSPRFVVCMIWLHPGAFVVFNNEESFLRCLDDYGSLSGKNCCTRRFTPQSLRFVAKAHADAGEEPAIIQVEQAPEPSNILFHNLEVSRCQRVARGLMSACVLAVRLASAAPGGYT